MFDNQLIALIISTIIAGEATAGIPGTPIKQAFQPTQQGVNTQPTAYLHKIGDKRYGSPARRDELNEQTNKLMHIETQQYESSFQISTLATQNPATPAQYTASDILNLIAYILQSTATIASLEAQGVGIYRVQQVSNPYFNDDRNRSEASPILEFTLTHKQIISSQMAQIAKYEAHVLTV